MTMMSQASRQETSVVYQNCHVLFRELYLSPHQVSLIPLKYNVPHGALWWQESIINIFKMKNRENYWEKTAAAINSISA